MVALSKVQWGGYRRWMEKDEAERMAAREQTRNGRLRRDSRKAEGAGTKSRHEGSRGAGEEGTPTPWRSTSPPSGPKRGGMQAGIYLESANFRSRGRFDYDYSPFFRYV